MADIHWHALSIDEALKKLYTSKDGLSPDEVLKRSEEYGPNELTETRHISPIRLFLQQFTDFLVIILLIAAGISAFIGINGGHKEELYDAAVIMIIVIFNATFGFAQEYKAEKAMAALKAMTAPQANVIRNGKSMVIPTRDLVPGDIVVLSAGTKIPADCRLIEASNLQVNEASLTGESVPAGKRVDTLGQDVIINDRKNMLFTSTIVERGRGVAIVTSIGMNTELGKIAGMVQAEKIEQTPLQKRLDKLGKNIGAAILGIVAVVFLVTYIKDPANVVEEFLTAVSLAVAAVPEGLPAVVTISLALSMRKMVKKNALVRRLPSVETLGAVTVICSDKTGTLTEGKMNVREIFVDGQTYEIRGDGYRPEGTLTHDSGEIDITDNQYLHLDTIIRAGVLCNDSTISQEDEAWVVHGDSTEGALIVAGERSGMSKEALEKLEPRVGEVDFTSERKRMTTFHNRDNNIIAYMKGAPEFVFERCDKIIQDGRPAPLIKEALDSIVEQNHEMASRGLRVLALAFRDIPEGSPEPHEGMEESFTLLGMVGMMDAPRSDAVAAITKCKEAGIKVVMITGDHQLTAQAVAMELGIFRDGGRSLRGIDLEAMTDKELEKVVEDVNVYARVSPEHKVRIVKALKENGHIVAMTGDGVNDAPALKKADIGVAMGITGTDVAKESSEMVLTDDNFATIVEAIGEGRTIYDNVRKFVKYMLSTNSGEVLVIFLASLMGMPLPLIAIQILWINLITDGFPALSLGMEPAEEGIMKRPPRNPSESIFAGGITYHIVWVGSLMTIGTLGIFQWALDTGAGTPEHITNHARTMAFITIAFFQLWHVLAMHVESKSVISKRFFANPWLLGAVGFSAILQLSVVYIPPLSEVFRTTALNGYELGLCVLVSSSVFFMVELEKVLRRALGKSHGNPKEIITPRKTKVG